VTAILVLDVGTTTLRAAIVDERLDIVAMEARTTRPTVPAPGLVEFDPAEMAAAAVTAAEIAIGRSPEPPVVVGITNQRASAVMWDRSTGVPLGPGLGWQDLRTVGDCIRARQHGLHVAPNQTATKAAWLLTNHLEGRHVDDVCIGTVDSWLVWTLTGGAMHVTDHSNAAVTGLCGPDDVRWNEHVLDVLGIPAAALPTIIPSSGHAGNATTLTGAPPIGALIGDQQASLVGQGCVDPGSTKITFGTGGMLDMCLGSKPPVTARRNDHGTYPVVAWSRGDEITYGIEAIVLSAGACVEWLRDLGLVESAAATGDVASSVDSADGVTFVPALAGLGTPHWDFGAAGVLSGLTRGSSAAHVVRAVLDGVAQRGVDLLDATVADSATPRPTSLRVDGGMTANPVFVQALADLAELPIEVSPVTDATTRGAAFLAGLAVGVWGDIGDAAGLWSPSHVVAPRIDRRDDRARWARSIERSRAWIPELSSLDF
jgi:glycerol kinase